MDAGVLIRWLTADVMLAHDFAEDMRPAVEQAVADTLDRWLGVNRDHLGWG